MSSSYPSPCLRSSSLRGCLAAFLQAPGLPFAAILCAEEIAQALTAGGVTFGGGDDAIYTPVLTLWAYLSQVVHDGTLSSCAATVARVIVFRNRQGKKVPSADTGNYCRARQKLPEEFLKRLAVQTGKRLEGLADDGWLWLNRHVKIADGTTLTMAATEANQKVYPQSKSQEPGLGFPILRMMVVLSLATATMCDVALAPYAGKQTGESTLLRNLLDGFDPEDLVVGDRALGNYFLIALGRKRRLDWVARIHQSRKIHYGRSRFRTCSETRVTWLRPMRPRWMDKATYAAVPSSMELRQIVVQVEEPGFRVAQIALITTLLDAQQYPAEAVAQLYRARWNVELDLRTIKQSLGMDHLRTKTPEMVRKEIWARWLVYNLIRTTIAQAALAEGKLPRQISFSGARQLIAASWDQLSRDPQTVKELAPVLWKAMAQQRVGDRPGRVEPRVVKRRKRQRLMMKPRKELQADLLAGKACG